MKHKRIIALVCMLALLGTALAALLPAGAEDVPGGLWNVYNLTQANNGFPMYGAPPSYTYITNGLRMETDKLSAYTVQSQTSYKLEEGVYFSLEVENSTKADTIMFHVWDQSGVLLGNYHSGSGWYGLVSLGVDGGQILSMNLQATSNDKEGAVNVVGIGMTRPLKGSGGSYKYTLSVIDGVFYINNTPVPGMDKIHQHLDALDGGEGFYIGATVMSMEGSVAPTSTLVAFGTERANAYRPKAPAVDPEETEPDTDAADPDPETNPVPDETRPTETETEPPVVETEPPVDETVPLPEETQPPVAETQPETAPSADTEKPGEGGGQGHPDNGGSQDKPKETYPTWNVETERVINNEDVNNLKDALGNLSLTGNCSSVLGGAVLPLLALVGIAAFTVRKKED